MHDYDAQAQYEMEKHYYDLAQAEAQLHDAGLTTGDLTEAQVFAVARALTAAVEQERRRCEGIAKEVGATMPPWPTSTKVAAEIATRIAGGEPAARKENQE